MELTRRRLMLAAWVALAGCRWHDAATPIEVLSLSPDHGLTGEAARLVVRGHGFDGRLVGSAEGGAEGVDLRFRAFLGTRELTDVRWIDRETLHATVPADLAPGFFDLEVRGPSGSIGTKPRAFQVYAPLTLPKACAPLPPPSGAVVEVGPWQASQLAAIVAAAAPGTTVLLEDGDYPVYQGGATVLFTARDLTLRSKSGDPSRVTLRGSTALPAVLTVAASGVTLADFTVVGAVGSAVLVRPARESESLIGTLVYDVHVLDWTGSAVQVQSNGSAYADHGAIACSLLQISEAAVPRAPSCSLAGIQLWAADGWTLLSNRLENIRCIGNPGDLALPAIRASDGSRGTRVERNVILDSQVGVRFGNVVEAPPHRSFVDAPCQGQHVGGVVCGNVVDQSARVSFPDSGIALWSTCGDRVVHNTVFAASPPFSSLEWRLLPESNDTWLVNNAVSHALRGREGAVAARVESNGVAVSTDFVDSLAGDFHLAPGSALRGAGVPLPEGLCDLDPDGAPRPSERPNIGAY